MHMEHVIGFKVMLFISILKFVFILIMVYLKYGNFFIFSYL